MRQKYREALKRRGVIVGQAWTPEQIAMLGTITDRDVAIKTGRTAKAVSSRRLLLGIAPFRQHTKHARPVKWTMAKDRVLGTMSDTDAARKLRCSPMQAFNRRRKLEIAAFRKM